MVPPCPKPLALDAPLRGRLLLEEIEGELADGGEVLGGVPLAGTGVVLSKGDVEDPVELVLDSPVGPDGAGGLRRREVRKAGDVDCPARGGAREDELCEVGFRCRRAR
jgi:hypothetical protein